MVAKSGSQMSVSMNEQRKSKSPDMQSREAWNVIFTFVVLLIFLAIGEFISAYFKLTIPGNVIGMILLTAALLLKIVKISSIEKYSNKLLEQLGLYFVPTGVGLVLYLKYISSNWLPLVASTIGSTIAVLWISSMMAVLLEKKEGEIEHKSAN